MKSMRRYIQVKIHTGAHNIIKVIVSRRRGGQLGDTLFVVLDNTLSIILDNEFNHSVSLDTGLSSCLGKVSFFFLLFLIFFMLLKSENS